MRGAAPRGKGYRLYKYPPPPGRHDIRFFANMSKPNPSSIRVGVTFIIEYQLYSKVASPVKQMKELEVPIYFDVSDTRATSKKQVFKASLVSKHTRFVFKASKSLRIGIVDPRRPGATPIMREYKPDRNRFTVSLIGARVLGHAVFVEVLSKPGAFITLHFLACVLGPVEAPNKSFADAFKSLNAFTTPDAIDEALPILRDPKFDEKEIEVVNASFNSTKALSRWSPHTKEDMLRNFDHFFGMPREGTGVEFDYEEYFTPIEKN